MTPLRREREKRGITQVEVARAIHVDQSHYSKIELGKLQTTPEIAERISMYFGYAISEIQILYPSRFPIAETAQRGNMLRNQSLHADAMITPLNVVRAKHKQTQDEVALAVGIHQGHYCRIEQGDVCPSPALARRIAAHFEDQITPMEIMDPAYYVTDARPSEAA